MRETTIGKGTPAAENPLGLRGIACVELGAPSEAALDSQARLLAALGFSRTHRHMASDVELWRQGDVRFLLDRDPRSFAASFAAEHGPSIPSMGWMFDDPSAAHAEALRRGATNAPSETLFGGAPAIWGIGGSKLHFLDADWRWESELFVALDAPLRVRSRGFYAIDHLTNNVPRGTLARWREFYKDIFGFTDVRTFDIRGRATGLTSYALRSPDGSFCIPINEGSETKSQIEEYLREYKGPGVQHLALLSDDLLAGLDGLREAGVETLDIDAEYYRTVFARVPDVREDHAEIERKQVLVDGDDEGYLLQIFTKNVMGPIFFELIQRRNHLSFGEGNFGALFRSIERDQERRGVL